MKDEPAGLKEEIAHSFEKIGSKEWARYLNALKLTCSMTFAMCNALKLLNYFEVDGDGRDSIT